MVPTGSAITKLAERIMLARTQGYQTMETPDGGERPLVRNATLEEYAKSRTSRRKTSRRTELTLYKPVTITRQNQRLGHGDRSERLRRMQQLRRRLPVGK